LSSATLPAAKAVFALLPVAERMVMKILLIEQLKAGLACHAGGGR
jgi:hypothetical protein